MAAVLQMNTKLAMVGIFDQIMGEDETIREKGIEYICGPLMSMRHKLFLGHPENEQYLLELIKKVRFTPSVFHHVMYRYFTHGHNPSLGTSLHYYSSRCSSMYKQDTV